jgi:hypothetical protein
VTNARFLFACDVSLVSIRAMICLIWRSLFLALKQPSDKPGMLRFANSAKKLLTL